jgi:hypothetical protein
MACGHTMLVEVLVPVPADFRLERVLGTSAFCTYCEPPEGHAMAISEVVSSVELHRGMCSMCGQPVPCSEDGVAIEHDRVDILAMLEAGAFDD